MLVNEVNTYISEKYKVKILSMLLTFHLLINNDIETIERLTILILVEDLEALNTIVTIQLRIL